MRAINLLVVPASNQTVQQTREQLDAYFLVIHRWPFSHETGAPHWLDGVRRVGLTSPEAIRSFEGIHCFLHFVGNALITESHERFLVSYAETVDRAYVTLIQHLQAILARLSLKQTLVHPASAYLMM